MIVEIKIPSLGESISEVEIASWLVKDGDTVVKDQPIAEIDSDKATLELPADHSGKIQILLEDGATVSVGDVVCVIDTSQADDQDVSETQSPTKSEVAYSSSSALRSDVASSEVYAPAAKKLSEEMGVVVPVDRATGKGGRVTKDDVLKYKVSMGTSGVSKILLEHRGVKTKKMSLLRRRISDRLVAVKSETAMLTTFNEVNMKPVMNLRSEYKEQFKEKHGVSLGFMSFFTRAVTRALAEFPNVNSMMDGQHQMFFDYADIGIAVSAPKGLMVPVIRNAEKMSFAKIEKEIGRLAVLARDGKLAVDDMTGGTFTITNGGVFGSMLSTPIINPPQSAILGMHNIVERPVVIKGNDGAAIIGIHPVMYLALSYDHRVIDGKDSVGFLMKIKTLLENPVEELIEFDFGQISKAFEI